MNNTSKKINEIRKWMKEKKIDAYVIPHDDEYLSEYIPPENERLAWATGFTGSAGTAIIRNDDATIFVDGRYTVQVKQQVNDTIFDICQLADMPIIKWMKEKLDNKTILGYDPRLHRVNWIKSMNKLLKNQVKFMPINENPIDIYWNDRPDPPIQKALLLDLKYAGKSSVKKRHDMGKIIASNKCDAAFITRLDSIAWLLNIRGYDVPCNPVLLSHGIIHANGHFDLFINKSKIPSGFDEHVGENVRVHHENEIHSILSNLSGKTIQLDFNGSNAWACELIINAGANVINKNDPCTLPKACKNETEIQGMKNCHVRDAIAVCNFLSWLDDKVESTEILDEGILSNKLDSFREKLDKFKGISFGTISAAGKNAAMCHYSHKNQKNPSKLEMNSVYLVDSGGQYLDGTTDITRTIAIGTPTDFMKEMFTLVLKGHISLGAAKFPEGIAGQHLDTLARQYLWHHGYDFEHGTGHGVGSYLNVHEGPHSIGKGANNVPLQPGMVVSNEPGYYEENSFGIRCENLILVKKIKNVNEKNLLGFENLTFVPFDQRLIKKEMLSPMDIDWINEYHAFTWKKISPLVDTNVRKWLKIATRKI